MFLLPFGFIFVVVVVAVVVVVVVGKGGGSRNSFLSMRLWGGWSCFVLFFFGCGVIFFVLFFLVIHASIIAE